MSALNPEVVTAPLVSEDSQIFCVCPSHPRLTRNTTLLSLKIEAPTIVHQMTHQDVYSYQDVYSPNVK